MHEKLGPSLTNQLQMHLQGSGKAYMPEDSSSLMLCDPSPILSASFGA